MIPSSAVRYGSLVGTGAAANVSLGFIPKRVDVFNLTDGTVAAVGFPNILIAFNTGVTAPNAPNSAINPSAYAFPFKIKGVTSGAVAKIKDVILVSGTFAGGNAAGFFVADVDEVVGTFGTENYTLSTSPLLQVDGACVVQTEDSLYQSAALGFVKGAGNTLITSYAGTTAASKGFTIGSTIAAAAKRLKWVAYRD
jgi:hypothetical protein